MSGHGSWDDRLSADERIGNLERALASEIQSRKAFQEDAKPAVDFYKASTLLGKILWIIGAVIVGGSAVWGVVTGWVKITPR
jgi:hypothetical protein